MRKYWPLFVLLLLLSASSGLYADVTLTDEQATELNQTLDELETTLKMQDETLVKQQQTIEQQEKTISELKTSYKKQSLYSAVQNILIAIVSAIGGALIALLFI